MDISEALVGKTIVSYTLTDDHTEIIFSLKGHPPVRLEAYGECCSQTWIESVDLPSVLKGRVVGVEDVEMPNLGNIGTPHHPDVEEVAYYGLKITTTKGSAVIDFRNDSNGYYGGNLQVKNG